MHCTAIAAPQQRPNKRRPDMNSLDSLRKMVDNFPGGRAVIAARLGKTEEVLRKELSGATSHKMGVVDAETITSLCREANSEHRAAYANAITSLAGGIFRLPVIDMASPSAVVSLQSFSAAVMRETADVAVSVAEGDADGNFSDNDLRAGMKEVEEARDALQKLEDAMRARHAASRPALRAA
jgi:hypothetical protein